MKLRITLFAAAVALIPASASVADEAKMSVAPSSQTLHLEAKKTQSSRVCRYFAYRRCIRGHHWPGTKAQMRCRRLAVRQCLRAHGRV